MKLTSAPSSILSYTWCMCGSSTKCAAHHVRQLSPAHAGANGTAPKKLHLATVPLHGPCSQSNTANVLVANGWSASRTPRARTVCTSLRTMALYSSSVALLALTTAGPEGTSGS